MEIFRDPHIKIYKILVLKNVKNLETKVV